MVTLERKRKAPIDASPPAEGSATKKLRLLNSNPAPSSKTNVQQVGQRVIHQLHEAKDKTGRPIADEFLTLPPRDELPDYYEFTKLPVALETIEEKLQRDEYPTVTTIESDLKRMVQNAKDYNDPNSQIYQDAERIRKLVFNFMKSNNPAYKEDPHYTSFATPIPKKGGALLQNGLREEVKIESTLVSRPASEHPKREPSMKRSSEQPDKKSSVAPSATTGDVDAEADGEGDDADADADAEEEEVGAILDFTGKTFQEAQQAMVAFLLRYVDEDGLEIYTPFGNLPTRKLEDYYKVIRHPVSLKSVAKRARGQHGRAPPSGQTDFKTWDAFENEVSYIWRNAREYNEDGSDMFNLAEDFEEHFKSLLAEAKEKVDEPAGPRLKIAGPKPKVTLNLSQHRNSPTPGVTVDNEALARQRQMVQAGVNGQQQQQRPGSSASLVNGAARPGSQGHSLDGARPSSSAHSGTPPALAGVKMEKAPHSPAPNNLLPTSYPQTNGVMPPPAMRSMSGSSFPPQMSSAAFNYVAPILLPPTQLRSYPIEAALLPTVTINTHPQLRIATPFSMTIPPHVTLSHQSTTVTLPNTHYFLQISPTISKQLSLGRPYKLFVSVNGTRLTQRDTHFQAESGRRTHVYEGSLAQGVNRIEVEVAAAQQDGDGKGLDVEKITVFANLMRSA